MTRARKRAEARAATGAGARAAQVDPRSAQHAEPRASAPRDNARRRDRESPTAGPGSSGVLRLALLLSCAAFGAPVLGAPNPPPAGSPSEHAPTDEQQTERRVGSVQQLAEAVATALQDRATTEEFRGGVRFVLEAARGIDEARARITLLPRLRRALRGGPLEAGDGPLSARVALSEEAGIVWAVVVVDGPGLAGPSTVVASAVADRELLAALGAIARTTQGRFVLERGGSLAIAPGCAPLDVALVDEDGDPALELAVLSRCGLEVLRVDDAPRLERLAGPFPLPPRRWPRVSLGWLAPVGAPPQHVWLATSAGHALLVDVRTGDAADAPAELVPLRSAATAEGPLALHGRFGSPLLALPLRTVEGTDVVVPGLPMRMRDLALAGDAWVFVAEDGTLAARTADGELAPLSPERVGDRLLAVDLDADGEPELVTTGATSPGEPDQLVVRRPAPDGSSSTVLLKSALGGGSIVGVAAGHVDFDARLDLIVLEESVDGATQTVWRLRHVP